MLGVVEFTVDGLKKTAKLIKMGNGTITVKEGKSDVVYRLDEIENLRVIHAD